MSTAQSAHMSPARRYSSDPTHPKHDVAERLTAWSDGLVELRFFPNSSLPGDPDSEGHLFDVELQDEIAVPDDEPELGTVDDRKDSSLERVVIEELRRMAECAHEGQS